LDRDHQTGDGDSAVVEGNTSFEGIVVYHRKNPSAKIQLMAMHGLFRSADDLAILAKLLPDVELITVDLPGHGKAPHSSSGYTPEVLARPIRAAYLAYKDDRPFFLLGESFSGLTALLVARLEPSIRHVILIDTPMETQRMANSWSQLMSYYDRHPSSRPMIAGICRDFYRLDFQSGKAEVHNYYEYVRRCPVPVMMISGTIKSGKPPVTGAFFRATDQAEIGEVDGDFSFIEVPKAGHSVLKLQPAAVGAIIKFLISQL
jgi:pimeloyl-ACP methyl ester carboxylesterase